MNKFIYFIVLVFFVSTSVNTEGYKDTPGYKDYLKLPEKYRSDEMEAIYKDGYDAEEKVKNLYSSKNGTVGQYLDKKSKIPVIDDLGWVTRPYNGGYSVERLMLLNNMKLSYKWHVDSNGKAIGITNR